jgi:urocanate hydratase
LQKLIQKQHKHRHSQGWVDEVFDDLNKLIARIETARKKKESVSLAYNGNIVELWEKFAEQNVKVEIGSDQTSLAQSIFRWILSCRTFF